MPVTVSCAEVVVNSLSQPSQQSDNDSATQNSKIIMSQSKQKTRHFSLRSQSKKEDSTTNEALITNSQGSSSSTVSQAVPVYYPQNWTKFDDGFRLGKGAGYVSNWIKAKVIVIIDLVIIVLFINVWSCNLCCYFRKLKKTTSNH